MLTKKDIQEGESIVTIMTSLNDEGKRIVTSFAEGALKMQEIIENKLARKSA